MHGNAVRFFYLTIRPRPGRKSNEQKYLKIRINHDRHTQETSRQRTHDRSILILSPPLPCNFSDALEQQLASARVGLVLRDSIV